MEIRTIAVLGAGTMGHGIAHAAAAGGYQTRMYDVSDAAVEKGRAAIEQIVRKGVELGKLDAADAGALLGRLTVTTSLNDALQGSDFVIEAPSTRTRPAPINSTTWLRDSPSIRATAASTRSPLKPSGTSTTFRSATRDGAPIMIIASFATPATAVPLAGDTDPFDDG